MLVLTRRPNEAIRIGQDIGVMILEVRGNQVRIGVQAPKDIAIDREEIYQRKLRAAELKAAELRAAALQTPPQ